MENTEIKVVSKLNDREKKQAALPIAVFGMEMVMQVSKDLFADLLTPITINLLFRWRNSIRNNSRTKKRG